MARRPRLPSQGPRGGAQHGGSAAPPRALGGKREGREIVRAAMAAAVLGGEEQQLLTQVPGGIRGSEAVSGRRRLWWFGAGPVPHCLPLLWSLQRLKAAVHYTVGCLCQEVEEDKDVQFSKQSIAAISEITFRQCGTAGLPGVAWVTWNCLVLPGLPQRSMSVQEPLLETQGFKNNSTELSVTAAFSCIIFFLSTRNTGSTFQSWKKHLDMWGNIVWLPACVRVVPSNQLWSLVITDLDNLCIVYLFPLRVSILKYMTSLCFL